MTQRNLTEPIGTKCMTDTGIIFAIINEDDGNREEGLKFAKSISNKKIFPIITDYIVDELLTLVMKRMGYMATLKVRDFIQSGYYELYKIKETDYENTFNIFFKYNKDRRGKKGISFTDCSSIVVSNTLGIKYIASFDPHHDVFKGRDVIRIDDPAWLI